MLGYLSKGIKKKKTNFHLWYAKGRESLRLSGRFSLVQHIILFFI